MTTRYKKELLSSYFIILFNIITPLILTPLLLNKLGPELYGLWILLSTILIYFRLSNFGLTTTFLKDISKTTDQEVFIEYTNTIFYFFIFIIAITLLPFIVIYFNLSTFFKINESIIGTSKIVFSLLFLIFSINLIGSIFDNIMFANKKLFIKNIIVILTSILTAIGTIILLIYDFSLEEIAILQLIMSLINLFFYFYYSKQIIDFKISFKYFNLKLLKEIIKPSVYYFIIGISVMISFYSDNIIISSFISVAAVSIYAIGYKVVNILEKIIFKIVDIMFPDISRLYDEKNYIELVNKHNKILFITVIIAFLGYGLLYFIGDLLIGLWVGKEYVLEMTIFNFFLAFAFIHTWNHVSSVFVMAMGLHKEVSYVVVIEAILNIILSIILLKDYGLLGVAMGTFFAHLLTNNWFTTFWFYYNIKRLQIKRV